MSADKKKKPTWSDLKRAVTGLDRDALLGLAHDLYATSKENRAFLHARFGLGDDVLEPYKETICRWVCPDVTRNQDYSISKAQKAIFDYNKAIGHVAGMAELSVYYCECCSDFLGSCGVDDDIISIPWCACSSGRCKQLSNWNQAGKTISLNGLKVFGARDAPLSVGALTSAATWAS